MFRIDDDAFVMMYRVTRNHLGLYVCASKGPHRGKVYFSGIAFAIEQHIHITTTLLVSDQT